MWTFHSVSDNTSYEYTSRTLCSLIGLTATIADWETSKWSRCISPNVVKTIRGFTSSITLLIFSLISYLGTSPIKTAGKLRKYVSLIFKYWWALSTSDLTGQDKLLNTLKNDQLLQYKRRHCDPHQHILLLSHRHLISHHLHAELQLIYSLIFTPPAI